MKSAEGDPGTGNREEVVLNELPSEIVHVLPRWVRKFANATRVHFKWHRYGNRGS